jgi:hypothetical protein
MSEDWREFKPEKVTISGNSERSRSSQRGGNSFFHSALTAISILSSLVVLFSLYTRDSNDSAGLADFDRKLQVNEQEEHGIPELALTDISELEDYSPLDSAFIKRTWRIATMHIPRIEKLQDTAMNRLLKQYSSLAQVRTLYMQTNQLGTELEAICKTLNTDSPAPITDADQKIIRRLLRQGKEYTYDATKRANGSMLKEQLLQKIIVDASLFNQRVVKQLDQTNKVLAYLSKCIDSKHKLDGDKLRSLTNEFKKTRIEPGAFDTREKLLRTHMIELKLTIVRRAETRNRRLRTF